MSDFDELIQLGFVDPDSFEDYDEVDSADVEEVEYNEDARTDDEAGH